MILQKKLNGKTYKFIFFVRQMQDIESIFGIAGDIKYFDDKSASLDYTPDVIRKQKQGVIRFLGFTVDDHGKLNREEETSLLREINHYNYRIHELMDRDASLKDLISLHKKIKDITKLMEYEEDKDLIKIVHDYKEQFSKSLDSTDKNSIEKLVSLYSKRQEAKDLFLACNYRLVIHAVMRYMNSFNGGLLEDLFEEGVIGLNSALERSDLRKNCRLRQRQSRWGLSFQILMLKNF